jgi:hypothetical protein
MKQRRILLPLAAGVALAGALTTSAAADASIPSGERVLGQSVLEPVYDDEQWTVATRLRYRSRTSPSTAQRFPAPSGTRQHLFSKSG